MPDPKLVRFGYTNHRGELRTRQVVPEKIYFGASQWHHGNQWLLDAYDVEKGANRTFAMREIVNWRPYSDDV